MNYIIYNISSGEIIKIIICSPSQIGVQCRLGEAYIEGTANRNTQKIENGVPINKTQSEQNLYDFSKIEGTIPPIDKTMTDVELNNYLNNYFYGQINIFQWKIDNYRILRKKFYPSLDEFIDAQIKINSQSSSLRQEGVAQFKIYTENCLDIKIKFPKE